MKQEVDVAIVGGGFYGCCMALYMRACGLRVRILERESTLFTRASYVNQARIHNGYHYPRNVLTAARSRVNFPRFLRDFPYAVCNSFTKLYGVARGSKVTAWQFHDFCKAIGAPIREASSAELRMFDTELVENVFETREFAFDAVRLRDGLAARLDAAEVDTDYGFDVEHVACHGPDERLRLYAQDGRTVDARHVFACVYADLNGLLRRSEIRPLQLKHELAEIALVEPPPSVRRYGVTVMDGPFFSTMPFPSTGLHSFSHVRYTPHHAWRDEAEEGPSIGAGHVLPSHFVPMLRDAVRFMPALAGTTHVRSLFTPKTTLAANENDDGRPILLRRSYGLPNFNVVMGGKIDNIYDLIAALADFSPQEHSIADDNDAFFEELFHGKHHAESVAARRKEYDHHLGGDRASRGATD